MDEKLRQYVDSVSVRETEVLRRLRAETQQMSRGGMQLRPNQGQLLGLLAQLVNAKRTLEIGVFTGYSSLCVAQLLPDDGKIIACDVSEEWTAIAKRYWADAGVADKIDLHIAPATETLQKLLDNGETEQFDFAFIDADKTSYDTYYEQCLQLVRPGGLIVFDNVLWGGRVADPSEQGAETVALRALNKKLHADDRIDVTLVPISDGLTLVRKRA